ncbi:MAG: hypothetical protein R2744_13550 [Bacteroidales bacterium]
MLQAAPLRAALPASLGGGVYEPLDIAVQNLGATGVFVALTAGNESDDANNHTLHGPTDPTFTVSAMDINDYWASFSNYGILPSITVHKSQYLINL